MRVVAGQVEAFDRAQGYIPEFELRLAGLKPLGGLESDLDCWSFLGQRVPRQPSSDHNGDNGDGPNDRNAPSRSDAGAGENRSGVGIAHDTPRI
jgi:hypothetical protein